MLSLAHWAISSSTSSLVLLRATASSMACSIFSLTFSCPEAKPTMYATPHMTTATITIAMSNIDIVYYYLVIDMEKGDVRAIVHDPSLACRIAEALEIELGRSFKVEADAYNL